MAHFKTADNFTRIFLLGAKSLSEDHLRNEFQEYGTIKDVYFVKDRTTNERKGMHSAVSDFFFWVVRVRIFRN